MQVISTAIKTIIDDARLRNGSASVEAECNLIVVVTFQAGNTVF